LDAAYSRVLALLYHKANEEEYGSVGGALEQLGHSITASNTIDLPRLSLLHLGDIVMMSDPEDDDEVSELILYSLHDQDLDAALWTDLSAHRMLRYNDNAGILAAGRFNGRGGWQP
jgi:hypothetical protein